MGRLAVAVGAMVTAVGAFKDERRGVGIYWDVDRSDAIITPSGIVRGNRGRDCDWHIRPYCDGNNGAAVNVYGNKGLMPHFDTNSTPINGGIPQNGNLSLHLGKFRRDLAAMIPDPAYRKYS